MDKSEFKTLFSEIAQLNGFHKAFGGWFKESSECIIVLDLQKSNFGNYYELNIKFFVQGFFGNKYIMSKNLVKKDEGDIFTRPPKEFAEVLNLESLGNNEHRQKVETLFSSFIVPLAEKGLSLEGLRELESTKKIFFLPAVKEEFGRFR